MNDEGANGRDAAIRVANPFDRDFEHSRALFDAALEEFVAKGYDQASINVILAQAGMSKGQFYYHFQGKEDLYFALIDILIARKRAFLADVMKPEDFRQDLFAVFAAQVRYGLLFAATYPAINRFAESFIREQGNAIYKKAMARYDFGGDDALNGLIEAAYRRGDFRDDLPLPFIKKTIAHLFTHAAEVADLNSSEDFEEKLDNLIAFMRSGLAKAG